MKGFLFPKESTLKQLEAFSSKEELKEGLKMSYKKEYP